MNFSLSKMPWHAQLGAFAALSLAAVGVFWNFYAKPAAANVAAREIQLSMVQADIQRGLTTARRLPQFRAQVADLQAQLERLRPVLPDEKDVADLLRRLQGMATQSNLTIREFSPKPVAARQMYAEWPIGLQLDGTYHNLGAFLERVSKFPRIINVTSIHIKPRDTTAAGAATISAECTATTFVLVEPSKAPTPAPGARKAPAAPAKAKAE